MTCPPHRDFHGTDPGSNPGPKIEKVQNVENRFLTNIFGFRTTRWGEISTFFPVTTHICREMGPFHFWVGQDFFLLRDRPAHQWLILAAIILGAQKCPKITTILGACAILCTRICAYLNPVKKPEIFWLFSGSCILSVFSLESAARLENRFGKFWGGSDFAFFRIESFWRKIPETSDCRFLTLVADPWALF